MDGGEPAVVDAEGVWFAYRRHAWILSDVSLAVPPGSFVGIIGPSGSGKTTLLKVLAGFLRPQRGTVRLFGRPVDGRLPRRIRRKVGYIPQQLGLVRSLTALENVLMGALGRVGSLQSLTGIMPQSERELAIAWLARLGIADKADERAFRLSGGERQRVAIARTLVQKPAVVFADEFISGLDQARAIEIISLLKRIGEEEGISFVFTMHEVDLMERFASHILVVQNGRIEANATPVPEPLTGVSG